MSHFHGRTRRGIALALGAALAATLLPLTAASAEVGDPRDLEEACSGAPSAQGDFSDYAFLRDEEEFALDCLAADGWRNIASGKADGTYAPSETVSRAQMATFIARLLQATGMTRPHPSNLGNAFTDDDPGTANGTTPEHHHNINWLYELGIVDGRPDTRDIDGDRDRNELVYDAHAPVLRDQMAKFIHGALIEVTGRQLSSSGDPFPSEDCDSSLEGHVNALAGANIVQGGADGRYDCDGRVRRGTMLLFLARPLDYLVEQGFADNPFVGTDRDFIVTPANEAVLTASTASGTDADRGRREYVARVGNTPVDIALVPAEFVTTAGGRTVFRDTDASPALADGLGATGAVVETVHGATVTPRNDRVDDAQPRNGEVRFTVDSTTTNEEVVPVVWHDVDDDDELDLTSADAPTESFGLGGAILWIPLEAGEGTTSSFEVVNHSAAHRFVTSTTATYYYGEAADVLYSSGGQATDITVTALANYLNGRGANVAGAVRGDQVTISYKQGTADRTTVTLSRDVPGPVRSLSASWTDMDGDGVGDDVLVQWREPINPDVNGYDVYRAGSNGAYTLVGSVAGNRTSFANVNVPAGQYRYVVLARNLAGDRGMDATPAVETVPDATALVAPYSLEGTFTNDPRTSTRLNPGDTFAFEFAGAPIAVAPDAQIVLRDDDGDAFSLTNGVNAQFSVSGDSEDVLDVRVTKAPTLVEANAGDEELDTLTVTLVESASGVVNAVGSWNLVRSGCVSDANGCPFGAAIRVLASRDLGNDDLPRGVDPEDVTVDVQHDEVRVAHTADERSGLAAGDPITVYTLAGRAIGTTRFRADDVDTVVDLTVDIADTEILLMTYRSAGIGDEMTSATSIITPLPPTPVVESVVAEVSSNGKSFGSVLVDWDQPITPVKPATAFEVYDATNTQRVTFGASRTLVGTGVLRVVLEHPLDDGPSYVLRIANGAVQNGPTPNDPLAVPFSTSPRPPEITSARTNADGIVVTFDEPVSCPTGGQSAWSFTNDSADAGGDGQASGAPDAITSNGDGTCTLVYDDREPGDFGTLDFTPSATASGNRPNSSEDPGQEAAGKADVPVVDGIIPTIADIGVTRNGPTGSGGSNVITVVFSELVRCVDVATSDFLVTYQSTLGGTRNPAVVSVTDCTAPLDSTVTLTVASAPDFSDDVTVTVVGQIRDEYGNAIPGGASHTDEAA